MWLYLYCGTRSHASAYTWDHRYSVSSCFGPFIVGVPFSILIILWSLYVVNPFFFGVSVTVSPGFRSIANLYGVDSFS